MKNEESPAFLKHEMGKLVSTISRGEVFGNSFFSTTEFPFSEDNDKKRDSKWMEFFKSFDMKKGEGKESRVGDDSIHIFVPSNAVKIDALNIFEFSEEPIGEMYKYILDTIFKVVLRNCFEIMGYKRVKNRGETIIIKFRHVKIYEDQNKHFADKNNRRYSSLYKDNYIGFWFSIEYKCGGLRDSPYLIREACNSLWNKIIKVASKNKNESASHRPKKKRKIRRKIYRNNNKNKEKDEKTKENTTKEERNKTDEYDKIIRLISVYFDITRKIKEKMFGKRTNNALNENLRGTPYDWFSKNQYKDFISEITKENLVIRGIHVDKINATNILRGILQDMKETRDKKSFKNKKTFSKILFIELKKIWLKYVSGQLLPVFSEYIGNLINDLSLSSIIIIEKSLGLDIHKCDREIKRWYDKETKRNENMSDFNVKLGLILNNNNNNAVEKNVDVLMKRNIEKCEEMVTVKRKLDKFNEEFKKKIKSKITNITNIYRNFMVDASDKGANADVLSPTPRWEIVDNTSFEKQWSRIDKVISKFVFMLYCVLSRNPDNDLSLVGEMIHRKRIESRIDDIFGEGLVSKFDAMITEEGISGEPEYDSYARFRIKMNTDIKNSYGCREEILSICQFLIENSGCIYNSDAKLFPNVFLFGAPASGKDYILDILEKTLIRGSVEKISRNTKRANSSECRGRRDDMISYTPEKDVTSFLKDKRSGGVGDAQVKDFLTSGKEITYRTHVDPGSGKISTKRIVHERRNLSYDAANPSIGSTVDPALRQRYIFIPLNPPTNKTSFRILSNIFDNSTCNIYNKSANTSSSSESSSSSQFQNSLLPTKKNKLETEIKDILCNTQMFVQLGIYEVNSMMTVGSLVKVSEQCSKIYQMYIFDRILFLSDFFGCRVPNFRKIDQLNQLSRTHCIRRVIVENFCDFNGKYPFQRITPKKLTKLNYSVQLQDLTISFGQLDEYLGIFVPGEIDMITAMRFEFYRNLCNIYNPRQYKGNVSFAPVSNDDPLSEIKTMLLAREFSIIGKKSKENGKNGEIKAINGAHLKHILPKGAHFTDKKANQKTLHTKISSLSGYVRFTGTKDQILTSICNTLNLINSTINESENFSSSKTKSMLADCVYDLILAGNNHIIPKIKFKDHLAIMKYCFWMDLTMQTRRPKSHAFGNENMHADKDIMDLSIFRHFEDVMNYSRIDEKYFSFDMNGIKITNLNNTSSFRNRRVAIDVHILYLTRIFDMSKNYWPNTTMIFPKLNQKNESGTMKMWGNVDVDTSFFKPLITPRKILKMLILEIIRSKYQTRKRKLLYCIDYKKVETKEEAQDANLSSKRRIVQDLQYITNQSDGKENILPPLTISSKNFEAHLEKNTKRIVLTENIDDLSERVYKMSWFETIVDMVRKTK